MIEALALFRKELIEFRRVGATTIATALLFATFMEFSTLRGYTHLTSRHPIADSVFAMAPTLTLAMVGPMFMPFMAGLMMSRSLWKERITGALMTVLASGVPHGVIWATKVCASCAGSYAVVLVAIALDAAMIRTYFHLSIQWSLTTVLTIFFVGPLASVGVVAAMAFLFWTVRFANLVAGLVPVVVWAAVFAYVRKAPDVDVSTVASFLYLAAIGSAAVLVTLGMILNSFSRRFILGL